MRTWIRWLSVVLLGLGGMLLVSCAGPHAAVTGQDPSPRFHNWWNFYEHGLAQLAAGHVEDARDDFERCLDLRPGARFGYPKDAWRVRTYGMHFLNSYFPNRELGICWYLLGDHAKSEFFLHQSLQQTPSGRAKTYLNRNRTAQLRNQKPAPPTIELAPSSVFMLTAERQHTLSGMVKGAGYIRALSINDRPRFVELAALSLPFEEVLALRPGTNVITILAEDLAGQTARQTLSWVADWDPPQLTVTRVMETPDAWKLTLVCSDAFGLSSVGIRGAETRRMDAKGAHTLTLTTTLRRGGESLLEASDLAGNQMRTTLSADALHLSQAGSPRAWLTMNGPARMLLAAVPAAAEPDAADALKPDLQLDLSGPIIETGDDTFFLDGRAQDRGGLISVRVNGEELLSPELRGAALHRFSRRLSLDDGTNAFSVVAVDAAGNQKSTQFAVVRRAPDYLDDQYRLSLGLPPVSADGAPDLASLVRGGMEAELSHFPMRFHLLERDEGWDFIMREQELSLSDLADPKAALRIGKMLPAELLLMTTLIREPSGTTLLARVVDAAKGTVLLAGDVYGEDFDANWNYYVAGLVMKVKQGFPLIEGEIVAVQPDVVEVNVGRAHGAAPGTRLVVVQKLDPGMTLADGRVRRFGTQVVELTLDRAGSAHGAGRVMPAQALQLVQPGDYVVAR